MYKLITVALIVAFTGCKEISYKEPQPKGKRALTEIPKELRGKYLIVEDDGTKKRHADRHEARIPGDSRFH